MPKKFPSLFSSAIAALLLSLSAASHAAAPGVSADTIVLGQSAALTGTNAEFGTEMRAGAMAYFDEVNAKGGVHGRQITLKTLDDAYVPERTMANTKQLIEQHKVFALFGYVGSVPSLSVLPLLATSDVPFVGPHTGSAHMRHPFKSNVFTVIAGYDDEAEEIAKHLDALSVKTVGMLYQDDSYGHSGLEAVERALKKRNMKLQASAMLAGDTGNVSAAVAQMRSAKPRAVIIAAGHKTASAFILETLKAGDTPPYFWSLSSVGSQSLAKDLGASGRGVLISHVIPSPWDESLSVVKEYRRLYGRPGNRISYTSLQGFLAAKTMVEGLRRGGKDLTRSSFTRGMESMRAYDLGGFTVKYSPSNHGGSEYVDLTVISAGGKLLY